jgi:phospholipid N-methyltransferase
VGLKLERMEQKETIPSDWTNKDNFAYYELIPYEIQKNYTVIGGLDVFSDLKLIKNYIDNANSILEVGACYGRVLDYLIQNNFKGKITAIEKSTKFFKLLQNQYSDHVNLHHEDISTFSTSDKFDLILWMWSGISDFAKDEQVQILQGLYNLLPSKGILILDTFSHAIKPVNAISSHDQSYLVHVDDCILYGYLPSPEEMNNYGNLVGFKSVEYLPYKTTTNRERAIYLLCK